MENELDRIERDRLLGAVTGIIHAYRNGNEHARESQRHEDSMTIWIVSLSSGAVIAIGPVLNVISDLHALPKYEVVFMFVPFALAILFGIAHRIILSRLMIADGHYFVSKMALLNSVQFMEINNNDTLRKEAIELIDDKTGGLPKLKQKSERWVFWADFASYFAPILFAIGIFNLVRLIVIEASQ
jgi:hypothetical protein